MSALISFLIIVLSIYLLAVVTEEFFIVSLDEVSSRLKLPSDVAGASLMAIGSSAPELFIALMAVLIGGDHGDIGVGTIVGSAIFNILVITGASAVVAGKLLVPHGPVERDITFYLGSIALLLLVFWNGEIVLWEAVMLLAAYAGYLGLLWYWSRTNPEDTAEGTIGGHHIPHQEPTFFSRLSDVIARIFSVIARDPEKHYIWAMLVSIGAIIGLSYVLVESTVVLSGALGLPPLLVSLTLLAAGTSAPDLIASISVAREGRGEMAVTNAVGSNIFDILVGLSVPWLIILLFMTPAVEVATSGLMESVFLLSVTTIVLYIAVNTERRLTRLEGYILLGVYVLYVGYILVTSVF